MSTKPSGQTLGIGVYPDLFHDGSCDFLSRGWSLQAVEDAEYRRELRLRRPIRRAKTKAIVSDRLNLTVFKDEDMKRRIEATGICRPQLDNHPEQLIKARWRRNVARRREPLYPSPSDPRMPVCDWRKGPEVDGISPYDSLTYMPQWGNDPFAASDGATAGDQGSSKAAPPQEPKKKWSWSDSDPPQWDYWDKGSPNRDHEVLGQLLRRNIYPGYTFNYDRQTTVHSDYNADVYKRRGYVPDEYRMRWDEFSRWGEQNIVMNNLRRLWNAPKEKKSVAP